MTTRIRGTSRRGAIAGALLAIGAVLSSAAALAGYGQFEPLRITSRTGPHDFQVEVMRTDQELQQGMMYRRSLAPDRGMLFEFAAEAPQAFWMENTYVPLDMIFIRADGIIHRIEADSEPLSRRSISSGAPVLGVLEVPGGTAARLGIKPGDRVEEAMFKP